MTTTIQQDSTGGVAAGWPLSLDGETLSALAVWAAAARAAAPARLASLARETALSGPMLTRGALDCESPGIDVVREAVSWGRHHVVRAVAGAGGDLGAVWECPLTGGPVNVLGLVLVRFHDLSSLGLMSPDMRADFLMTLAEVVDAVGSTAMVGDVPPALAADLAAEFEGITGQRISLVWGC